MKLNIVLATTTALGLLMVTGAWAGDNNTAKVVQTDDSNIATVQQSGGNSGLTVFTQTGDDNKATVTQTGNGNTVGNHENTSDTYGVVWQNGNKNEFNVSQSGGDSVANGSAGARNFLQIGGRNLANITQRGSQDNVAGVVQQSNSSATALTNKLTIVQKNATAGTYGDVGGSDYNYGSQYIESVVQTHTGGAANEMSLTQTGGVYNAGSKIISAVQDGSGNSGTVTQAGRSNFLALLSQTGSGNDATVALSGTGNGDGIHPSQWGPWVGSAFTSTAALGATGVVQATAIQAGDDQFLSYRATGDGNLYGFSQTSLAGTGHNHISGTTNGNDNEAAIGQDGISNTANFTQAGDDNYLGVSIDGDDNGNGSFRRATAGLGLTNGMVSQSGGNNTVSFTIVGDTANYAVSQTGGHNTVTASLTGGDSNNLAIKQTGNDTASVGITGSQNVLGVDQRGAGPNKAEVTIVGSLNNWTGSLNGTAGALGLTAGLIFQNNNAGGAFNNVDLTVMTDSNLFAIKQVGSNNSVTGNVLTGTANQAAVLQLGSNNATTYTQNGAGNNIGVSQ